MTDFIKKSKEILKIAIPSGLGSFLDILNASVSLLFMSKLSTNHIVALGIGLNFIMLFFVISALFFTGTNAQISRFFGEGKTKCINDALSTISIGSIGISIPLCVLAFFSYEFYVEWIGIRGEGARLATIFLSVLVFSIPSLLLKTTLTSSFSAIGNAKTPFIIKLFCTLINIALSYALIFGVWFIPSLDMLGAGIANILASYIECIILLVATIRTKIWKRVCFEFRFLKNMLKIGIPTGMERGFTLFSLVLISKFLLFYGEDVLAGFQIGGRIEAFAFMPGFGFMVASMSLMGQKIKNIEESKSYVYANLTIASIFMGTLGIVMIVFGTALSSIFTSQKEVLQYSFEYLLAVGLSQIPLIFIFVIDGAIRGSGATKISLMVNALSIWGIRILPMYLCTKYQLHYYYIFIIIFLETYIRAGIFWFIFKKELWRRYIIKF